MIVGVKTAVRVCLCLLNYSVTTIRNIHVIYEDMLKHSQLLSLSSTGLLRGDELVRHPNGCHTREYVVIAGRAKLLYQ